jgi:hypothetical protein
MQMVSARPTSSLAKLAHRRVQSLAELPTLEQAKVESCRVLRFLSVGAEFGADAPCWKK